MIFTQILISVVAGFLIAAYVENVMARSMGPAKPNNAAVWRLGASTLLGALAGGATWECSALLIRWMSL